MTKHTMRLFPWQEVIANAETKMRDGAQIFQQWNCEHCGAKQTMDRPDTFFETGICEQCGKITDIKKNGHNFMAHFKLSKEAQND
jgi:hypothetical protein